MLTPLNFKRVDAIVLLGAFWENDIAFRGSVVERLTALGIKLDVAANNVRGQEAGFYLPIPPSR